MKKLRIYLGDLTHDTVGLATEVFPLNVGFVAAYCQKLFGDKVELRLFKYIPKLEQALLTEPPDILALSNYPWCHNANMELFTLLSRRRPEALRVMGGPNFPHAHEDQAEFMRRRPILDAHVYLDGEVGFSGIVEAALKARDLAEARAKLREVPIDGVAQHGKDGGLLAPVKEVRKVTLDEIPSPYLSGLMDEFFDGRLSPMIQTNRGCPFTCTFCHDGTTKVNKVNQFGVERVKQEIRYIAERAPATVRSLFISDLNFGMYPRDQEICAELALIRKERGYPKYIDSTTGKNSKDRVIRAIEQLDGALGMTMSVQSLDMGVLEKIKRDNIRLDDFLALKPAIRASNLPTVSEVILGLPGETFESHMTTIGTLLDAEMDAVTPYTLMLVNGSELATAAERRKWAFKTKFRVIPRDFTRLSDGRKIVEVEEVAIESNTLPFEDYVKARRLALILRVATGYGFKPLVRFINERKLRVIELIKALLAASDGPATDGPAAPRKVISLLRAFENQTRGELWDSEEDVINFFQDDKHFEGLINGDYGANLMQLYGARCIANAAGDWVDFVFHHAWKLVDAAKLPEDAREELKQIEAYSRALHVNMFGPDRLKTTPEVPLTHDIAAWISDPADRPLSAFRWETARPVRFELTEDQFQEVEHGLSQFGRNEQGLAKTLIRVSYRTIWRRPAAAQPPTAARIFSS